MNDRYPLEHDISILVGSILSIIMVFGVRARSVDENRETLLAFRDWFNQLGIGEASADPLEVSAPLIAELSRSADTELLELATFMKEIAPHVPVAGTLALVVWRALDLAERHLDLPEGAAKLARDHKPMIAAITSFSLMFGVEIWQRLVEGQAVSGEDVIANTVGIMLAMTIPPAMRFISEHVRGKGKEGDGIVTQHTDEMIEAIILEAAQHGQGDTHDAAAIIAHVFDAENQQDRHID